MDLLEKMFIGLLSICTVVRFSSSLQSNYKEPMKCVTFNNRPCQAIPTLASMNSDKILFYPFTVSINKCGGSCKAIDDPNAWVCVNKSLLFEHWGENFGRSILKNLF